MSVRDRRRGKVVSKEAVARTFCVGVGATIEARNIVQPGCKVLLAVSGGADSLAMMHAICRLRERFELKLEVAHIDHQVRRDSADDAKFVLDQSELLGLQGHLRIVSGERVKGQSLEEVLRTRRGDALVEIADEVGASRILTGHTQNDQAETVLMNLLSGAGRRGLGGMPPTRFRLGRPLIDRTRKETEDFCEALGLVPREDSTNADFAFLRNRVRHEVIPRLAEIDPQVVAHFAAMSDVNRDEDYLLDSLAAEAVPPVTTSQGSAADVEKLRAAHVALRRRIVRLLGRNEYVGLSLNQVDQILDLIESGGSGKIDLDGPLCAWLADGLLVIGRQPTGA